MTSQRDQDWTNATQRIEKSRIFNAFTGRYTLFMISIRGVMVDLIIRWSLRKKCFELRLMRPPLLLYVTLAIPCGHLRYYLATLSLFIN